MTRWRGGGAEFGDRRSEMGAEGREPSGEDRGWKLGDGSSELGAGSSEMGDRDALARRGKRRFEISGFFRHLTFDIRHCTERLGPLPVFRTTTRLTTTRRQRRERTGGRRGNGDVPCNDECRKSNDERSPKSQIDASPTALARDCQLSNANCQLPTANCQLTR